MKIKKYCFNLPKITAFLPPSKGGKKFNVTTMKAGIILFFFFACGGILCAQEKGLATIPPDESIHTYLSETKKNAALFNGKVETPYDQRFENHPYLETDQYVRGTLCYNHVVYRDIFMRIDLFRDELTVFSPDKPYRIVLDKEKFNYAVLHGLTIITSTGETDTKTKYMLLVYDGIYPVVIKYQGTVYQEISSINHTLKRFFRFKRQCLVYVDGMAYPVKNKNALLKLFPAKKKELNEYAKQQKLDFKSQYAHSIVALVNHYENLTK